MTAAHISSLGTVSPRNSGALAGFAEKPTSGSSNVSAELAVKAHPFFIRLTKSERLAIATTARNVWLYPLAALPSFVCGCRSVLCFEFIERLQRSFQFWRGDCFHAPSVARSAMAVTDWQATKLFGGVCA